jgi:hypothetical protein
MEWPERWRREGEGGRRRTEGRTARRSMGLARRAPCHRETWPRTRGDLCREAGEEGEPVPAASPRLLPGREVHTSESQSTRAEGSRAGGAGRDRGGSEGEVRTMS